MKNIFCIIILLFMFFISLTNTNLLINSTNNAIINFKNTLLPTLFPTFILSDLLINYNFYNIISNFTHKLFNKIFKINKPNSFILVMGMLTGYSNTFNIILNLYDKNIISDKEINKIILFTNFINPIYIISILSIIINFKISLYILFISYVSNFIIGFIYRNYNICKNNYESNIKTIPLFNYLIVSIKKNINNLLFILGINIFVTIISDMFLTNSLLSIFIKGLLDFTNGLSIIKNLSFKSKIIFSLVFISFGGINAHMQCINVLNNINYKKYLKARLLQIIISIILALPVIVFY